MQTIITQLRTVNKWLLIVIAVFFDFITSFVLSLFFEGNNSVDSMKISTVEKAIIIIFLAPVIETVFFQKFVISFIEKHTGNITLAISVSAAFFGLAHTYSLPYMVKGVIAGLLYGLLFVVFRGRWATALTILAHSSYNFICFSVFELIPFIKK